MNVRDEQLLRRRKRAADRSSSAGLKGKVRPSLVVPRGCSRPSRCKCRSIREWINYRQYTGMQGHRLGQKFKSWRWGCNSRRAAPRRRRRHAQEPLDFLGLIFVVGQTTKTQVATFNLLADLVDTATLFAEAVFPGHPIANILFHESTFLADSQPVRSSAALILRGLDWENATAN